LFLTGIEKLGQPDLSVALVESEFCNCDIRCYCNFGGFPNSKDRSSWGWFIDSGSRGSVDLSGVKCAATVAWPKAIQEGRNSNLSRLLLHARPSRALLSDLGFGLVGCFLLIGQVLGRGRIGRWGRHIGSGGIRIRGLR
jgi:Protein of unknown function (DUF1326)